MTKKKIQTDLVLIHPNPRRRSQTALPPALSAVEPPLWAALLSSHAQSKELTTVVIDAEAEDLSAIQIAARVEELDPTLAAIVVYGRQPAASTENMTGASAAATAVKSTNPERPLLMMGGHVAALPRETLEQERLDYTCCGEGFATLPALVAAIKTGKPEEIAGVPDLWFREGRGRPTFGGVFAKALSERQLPSVAWDQLPMNLYRAPSWQCFGHSDRAAYASLYTSLGCPYSCSFCCVQAPFRTGEKATGIETPPNSYRAWSPKAVLDQIDALVETYGVRHLRIADEMFVVEPKHVLDICNGLIKRKHNLNISANARIDTVDPPLLEKMKKAGFNWLSFGIEAGSERVRSEAQKTFGAQQVLDTVRRVKDAGINVVGNFIFGLPEDDRSSMQETLDLAMTLQCEFAQFHCAMPFPGSPLYAVAIQENWPLPDTWSGYCQYGSETTPLPTKHVSAVEVLRFRDHAFQTYFSSPSYQSFIGEKFGPDALRQIQELAAFKIHRKFLPPLKLAAA